MTWVVWGQICSKPLHSEYLPSQKEESLRMVVLEKAENILKMKDLPWEDRYMGIALSNVLKQAVESYDR